MKTAIITAKVSSSPTLSTVGEKKTKICEFNFEFKHGFKDEVYPFKAKAYGKLADALMEMQLPQGFETAKAEGLDVYLLLQGELEEYVPETKAGKDWDNREVYLSLNNVIPLSGQLILQNQVFLCGRVGADPDVLYFESGRNVSKVRMCAKGLRDYWANIEFWGKEGEVVANYVRKGTVIAVQGSLGVQTWANGKTFSKVVVTGNKLDLLSKGAGESNGARPAAAAQASDW